MRTTFCHAIVSPDGGNEKVEWLVGIELGT